MVRTLQFVSILLASIGMALALAHALEYPGKRRLDRDTYFKVQTIYYPGFTIGGIGEPLAVIAVLALLLLTPLAARAFWPTAVAFGGLLLAQTIYWAITHPANKVWLQDQELGRAGAAFFDAGTAGADRPWTAVRDRWEWSHVVRAALFLVSLMALVVAVLRPQ
jgi:hypothetical protein